LQITEPIEYADVNENTHTITEGALLRHPKTWAVLTRKINDKRSRIHAIRICICI
jgi:hypothetical protein